MSHSLGTLDLSPRVVVKKGQFFLYGKCAKILNTFFFCLKIKCLVIKAVTHKMLV